MSTPTPPTTRSRFPPLFWLVVVFEFFERGSYYGMMSVLSVYLTDVLHFSKPDVGVIKGTIQPLLYFLPILSGALADRFGFRRMLLLAFGLLGTGYFLTSQSTGYAAIFLSLVVMGLGAGTFKPIISGTIARCTDPTNNTLGFGIFYWSINLGAFLFPLFLVPLLKNNIGWSWVFGAAAIGTGAMLVPTLLFFREPPAAALATTAARPNLLQTLANAFEIIYSPFVLLHRALQQRHPLGVALTLVLLVLLLGGGTAIYLLTQEHSFVTLFIGLLLAGGLVVCHLAPRFRTTTDVGRLGLLLATVGSFQLILWLLPGLSLLARILCGIIALSLNALFVIDTREPAKFKDHLRFLVMIFIYSGFWVLYFQMFDSVLWYVRDYVSAASLDQFVNRALLLIGLDIQWKFDVEHVTVINAGTIILLQLLVSQLTRRTRAMPTMITGIALGTVGMAILAINTDIWVFLVGIVIFSVGEMVAHPKFISYVGETAPKARVALYMGYLFLYGVIGGSIGSVVGANLYVVLVDELKQPRILWLLFAGIGGLTILGLVVYDRVIGRTQPAPPVTLDQRP